MPEETIQNKNESTQENTAKADAPAVPQTPKEEEPVFPLEEFVGETNSKPEVKAENQPGGQTPATAPKAPSAPSAAPSVPNPPASPSSAPSAPSVPNTNTKPSKRGVFSFAGKKQSGYIAATPGQPAAGTKAVIKRPSRVGKLFMFLLIAIAGLLAIFFFFFYRVTINISVTPTPDDITIDSKEATAGSHKLMPGFHEIKVEKEGYISYYASRDFKIGEKLNLNFTLEPAVTASTIVTGASDLGLSASSKYLNYLGNDGRFYSTSLTKQSAEPTQLAQEQFSNVRKFAFSKNNDFALVLTKDMFKIVDFVKTDPTAQDDSVELPPSASAISSFSWNNNSSSYVSEANSKILYDLKTSSAWDLFMMDRTSKYSQIVMRIDSARFQNLNIDWGESDRTVLLTGNEAGLLDLGTREYTPLEQNGGFTDGKWGPSGQYAVLTKSDGHVYLLKDGSLQDLSIVAKSFFFKSKNEAYFLEGSHLVSVNFDTNSRINYAEISGLANASMFAVYSNNVYFIDTNGLESAVLQEGAYGEN